MLMTYDESSRIRFVSSKSFKTKKIHLGDCLKSNYTPAIGIYYLCHDYEWKKSISVWMNVRLFILNVFEAFSSAKKMETRREEIKFHFDTIINLVVSLDANDADLLCSRTSVEIPDFLFFY